MSDQPDEIMLLWEVYERDGTRCACYLKKEDADNCDVFARGVDRVVRSSIYVSVSEKAELQAGRPIFPL